MKLVWVSAGHVFVALAFVGIFLPLLPTTPFLLLAAACYSRGSKRFENWLLSEPRLGPIIRDWRAYGVVTKKTKIIASLTIAVFVSFPLFIIGLPTWLRILTASVVSGVLIFLWTRPSEKPM